MNDKRTTPGPFKEASDNLAPIIGICIILALAILFFVGAFGFLF